MGGMQLGIGRKVHPENEKFLKYVSESGWFVL